MQIEPSTARYLAHLSGGSQFALRTSRTRDEHRLRQLLPALPAEPLSRQRTLALAAYNAGMTNVDRWVANARATGTALIQRRSHSRRRALRHEGRGGDRPTATTTPSCSPAVIRAASGRVRRRQRA